VIRNLQKNNFYRHLSVCTVHV